MTGELERGNGLTVGLERGNVWLCIRSPLMVVVAINSYWIVLMFTYDHSYILIFASLFMEQA